MRFHDVSNSTSLHGCGHVYELYVTTPPQTVVGGRVCPYKNFVFAPCMAVRERCAAAVHHNIILGVSPLVFISMFRVSCAIPRGRDRVSSLWVFDVFRVLYDVFLICLICVCFVNTYRMCYARNRVRC